VNSGMIFNSMTTLPFLAVLLSALLHASWNAIARASSNPGDVFISAVISSGIIGLAGLFWSGLPAHASWFYLAFGLGFNTAAIRFAIAAYKRASFALAYPAMRAGIPLTTLPIAAIMIHELPRPFGILGVLLIATALILLAVAARNSKGTELNGVGYAMLSALCGAGYVTSDAVGVRLSGNVMGYAFALAVGNAILISLLTAIERRNPLAIFKTHMRTAFGISTISMSSFLFFIWAVSVAPVALASALRETSVLFAIGIAHFVLKDKIGRLHIAAVMLALAGIAAIKLG
jgi:drug/metabolite transporter (DMT)-like permease